MFLVPGITYGKLQMGSCNAQTESRRNTAPREAAGEDTLGPFWSSNGGSISFTEQADGTLLGEFSFTADNPSAVDNTALGTIQVVGDVTLNNILTLKTVCGMQSFSIGMVTLLGLCLVRFGLRRQRAR